MPNFENFSSALETIEKCYSGWVKKEPETGIYRVVSLLFRHDFAPGAEGCERYKRFCRIAKQEGVSQEQRLANLCQFYLNEKRSSRLVAMLGQRLMQMFGIQSVPFYVCIQATVMRIEHNQRCFEDAMREYIRSQTGPAVLAPVIEFKK